MSSPDTGSRDIEAGLQADPSADANTSPVTVRHGSSGKSFGGKFNSRLSRRLSRRRFLGGSVTLGTALGASLGTLGQAFASDCDQQQTSRCSDSDTGENSDPTNCGRCGREPAVPS